MVEEQERVSTPSGVRKQTGQYMGTQEAAYQQTPNSNISVLFGGESTITTKEESITDPNSNELPTNFSIFDHEAFNHKLKFDRIEREMSAIIHKQNTSINNMKADINYWQNKCLELKIEVEMERLRVDKSKAVEAQINKNRILKSQLHKSLADIDKLGEQYEKQESTIYEYEVQINYLEEKLSEVNNRRAQEEANLRNPDYLLDQVVALDWRHFNLLTHRLIQHYQMESLKMFGGEAVRGNRGVQKEVPGYNPGHDPNPNPGHNSSTPNLPPNMESNRGDDIINYNLPPQEISNGYMMMGYQPMSYQGWFPYPYPQQIPPNGNNNSYPDPHTHSDEED